MPPLRGYKDDRQPLCQMGWPEAGTARASERAGFCLGLLPVRWGSSLSPEGLEVRTIQRAAHGGGGLALSLVQALKSRGSGDKCGHSVSFRKSVLLTEPRLGHL